VAVVVCLASCILVFASETTEVSITGQTTGTASQALEQAVEIVTSGENLFDAYRSLHAIDVEELEAQQPQLLGRYWWARGWTAYELGRYDELNGVARELVNLGGALRTYGLYYQAAAVLADERRFDQKGSAVSALRGIVEQEKQPDPVLKLAALLVLAKLHEGEVGWQDLSVAREQATRLGREELRFHVRIEAARRTARSDPQQGYEMLERAMRESPPEGPLRSLYGWEARLEVVWSARPRAEAIKFSLELLQAIEAGRQRQEELGTGSMGFFSVWARAYRRVVGLILSGPDTTRADIELAFHLSEKMRARVLLDEIHAMGARVPECASEQAQGELLAIRGQISAGQRSLTASGPDREKLVRRIGNLMLDEEAVYRGLRCLGEPAESVGLSDVEKTLNPGEALLVFQTGNERDVYGGYDGGSWVFVVTSNHSRVVQLPDERIIRLKKDALLGAVRRRDGSEVPLSSILHNDLIRPIQEALPHEVHHLVIASQGSVYGVPFALLRETADASPLVENYAVSHVPSASLWYRWKHSPRIARGVRVLALSNPHPGEKGREPWQAMTVAPLGTLPSSRREARALLRAYGNQGAHLEGKEASECALKAAHPQSSILLFAAHAVVDEESPRRSAVVLSAEGDEDGLLQPPEIALLGCDDTLVVLSGCQSTSGPAVEGEGLLSLARAFFQAGSRVVVGNGWAVRDDEASALFGDLYRYLASGKSVAEAVQAAQLEHWRAGAPAEAWAGLIVVGDAAATFPAGRSRSLGFLASAMMIAMVTFSVALLAKRSRVSA